MFATFSYFSGQSYSDRDYFYNECVSATTSCTTSVASSDFSDDGYIDIEDDTLSPFVRTVRKS